MQDDYLLIVTSYLSLDLPIPQSKIHRDIPTHPSRLKKSVSADTDVGHLLATAGFRSSSTQSTILMESLERPMDQVVAE